MDNESNKTKFISILLPVSVLFFISGFSALVYEVAWGRMFGLIFGNTVQATCTVLAAYMAGLALGSYLFGRLADRKPKALLRLYGLLEIAIGLTALLLMISLEPLDSLHHYLYRVSGGLGLSNVVWRFAISFSVLILPTSFMGGTLPILSRLVIRRSSEIGTKIGGLYAVNTLGAVVGAFLAGYFLVAAFGLKNSQGIAIALNIAVGLGALYLSFRSRGAAEPEDEKIKRADISPGRNYLAPAALTVQGFCALAFEVVWTRMLVFYLGNSVYAFSVMLTTFLFGIGLGSLIFTRISSKIKRPWRLLGLMQAGIGLYGLAVLFLMGWMFFRVGDVWGAFGDTHWANPTWIKFTKSFLVMFLPTLLTGASFPLAAGLYARRVEETGSKLGKIYSLNTLGAIFGSLAAGFVLIPSLGITGTTYVLVTLMLAMGVILLVRSRSPRLAYPVGGLMVIIVIAGLSGWGSFRFFNPMVEKEPSLFYREGRDATVRVFEDDEDGVRHLSINGWPVAGSGTHLNMGYPAVQKPLGHFPALLHGNPKSCLVVGFGSGGTTWALSLYHPDSIQVVELVDAVLDAADMFPEVNHGVLNLPFVRAVIDDGRHFIGVNESGWDLIAIDSVDPKFAGNGNLYSLEFFQACRHHLNPGGVLAIWLPFHQLSPEADKIIARTFIEAFPHATMWFTRFAVYAILVGTVEPLEIDLPAMRITMENDSIRGDLADLYLDTPENILECFGFGPEGIRTYTGEGELNTYDYPVVEFFGLNWQGAKFKYQNLHELAKLREPIWDAGIVRNMDEDFEAEMLERYNIFSHIIEGQLYTILGEKRKRQAALAKAYLMADNHSAIKFMLGISEENVDIMRKAYSWLNLGHTLLEMDFPDEALEALKESVSLNPENATTWNVLAQANSELGEFEQAVYALREARKLEPQNGLVHFNLGVAMVKAQMPDSAMQVLNRAIRLNPDLNAAPIWQNIALMLKDESLPPFDRVMKLASLYSVAGEWESALIWAEEAVNISPDSQEASSLFDQISGRLGIQEGDGSE